MQGIIIIICFLYESIHFIFHLKQKKIPPQRDVFQWTNLANESEYQWLLLIRMVLA